MKLYARRKQERIVKLCVPREQGRGEKHSVKRKQEVKLCISREKGQGMKLTLRRDFDY